VARSCCHASQIPKPSPTAPSARVMVGCRSNGRHILSHHAGPLSQSDRWRRGLRMHRVLSPMIVIAQVSRNRRVIILVSQSMPNAATADDVAREGLRLQGLQSPRQDRDPFVSNEQPLLRSPRASAIAGRLNAGRKTSTWIASVRLGASSVQKLTAPATELRGGHGLPRAFP
jgi:hypothetical protein